MNTIETADIVKHGPTGEKWLVAYVERDKLCACGWPESLAQLSDCTLIKKATEEEKQQLTQSLAAMSGSEYDSRRSWAKNYLKEEANIVTGVSQSTAMTETQVENFWKEDLTEKSSSIQQIQLHRIVVGQLRNAVNTHGPITLDLIGSAAKRITAQLMATGKWKE